MHNPLKIGIVGCGAIGSSLAKAIFRQFRGKAKLVSLFDIDRQKAGALSAVLVNDDSLVASRLSALISKSDLVIETSSAKCSFSIAQEALKKSRDCMVLSVGGILNKYRQLAALAEKHNSKIYLPSGAISGIDAIKALKCSKIKEVVLTTIKNPASFRGVKYIKDKGIKLESIRGERILFSGSANEAVKYFPQNINVAAILSIAGIGPEKTKVRIIASAKTRRNIHQIKVYSEAGTITTRTENILHPENPKTSYLAYLSSVAVLRQILGPVKVGS